MLSRREQTLKALALLLAAVPVSDEQGRERRAA